MAASIESDSPLGLHWRGVLIGLGLVLVILIALFRDTLGAMVGTWMGSETYAHGFLIVPISLWLAWEKRAVLRTAVPQPVFLPVLLMVPVGMIWLASELVGVRVIQEYSVVGLLILAIWAMIGTPVARILAFPLGFLLLAVPVGDWLTYPLMNFTADFVVDALRLTGIPVYRDGTFFSLPSGDWSVVEECSGIRYILASMTLGVLYAYLTYHKTWKRLLFVGMSLLVPVLANGLRAYMIVMIGHLSDMKLATGVDHLIYGWVFFGIVIAAMFGVGAIWRDPEAEQVPEPRAAGPGRGVALVGVAAVLAAALWPGLLGLLGPAGADMEQPVTLQQPRSRGAWQTDAYDFWTWRPTVVGADGEGYWFYRGGSAPVGLYLGVYRSEREGAEVVSVLNKMVPTTDLEWADKEITTRRIRTPDGPLEVKQDRLASRIGGARLLVWNWYRIGTVNTSNPYVAKFVEAGYRLTGRKAVSALIAVAVPYRESPEEGVEMLEGFLADMWSPISDEIDRAAGRNPHG